MKAKKGKHFYKKKVYHSEIDLVGISVSKKSLSDTSDGVLRSWAHMVPPTKPIKGLG